MAIDLTGGLPVEWTYFLPEKPGPEVRDATNVWLQEENGAFAMRIGVEGVAEQWDGHDIWLDIAFPDGRVLSAREAGKTHDAIGPEGKPTILGAGPLHFRCVEPFKRWTISFAPHPVRELSAQQLIDEDVPASPPMRTVAFEIAFSPAVPPLVSGTLTAESRKLMSGEQGSFISPRYEQLCRAEGTLTIDGVATAFKGQILHIKRQGVRKFEGFWGHCWQSALFPSGKAFGVNTFPPREDGQPNFNEGFIFTGDGDLKPAKAIQSPWMRKFHVSGEPVPLILETEDGEQHHIDGTTFINCRSLRGAVLPDSFPQVQQAHAHYRWDGEEATGMVERSTFSSQMER